jgi:hypothetical protein
MKYLLAILILVSCSTSRNPKSISTTSANKESFNDFYRKFHSDSLFQVSRVVFPLPTLNSESNRKVEIVNGQKVNKYLNSNNWRMHHQLEDTATYKVKTQRTEDSVVETIYIPDSEFSFTRTFKLIQNKWRLVYIKE